MIVFESPECPYCERFKKEVAPVVSAIYGDRVRIRYVDAAAFAEVRVTPTILLRSRSGSSLLEGLPNPQLLIRAIGQMLSSHTLAGVAR
jgi:thioredoxin-related protein